MTEKLSDMEKLELILKTSQEKFSELSTNVMQMQKEMRTLQDTMESTTTLIKRYLNEEKNGCNIHKQCEYYNEDGDYCSNYLMGRYTGLAFEVSRHDKCIEEIINE